MNHDPVKCTVGVGGDGGVHFVSDQPEKRRLAEQSDVFLVCSSHVGTAGVEISQKHHIRVVPLVADFFKDVVEPVDLLDGLAGLGMQRNQNEPLDRCRRKESQFMCVLFPPITTILTDKRQMFYLNVK